MVLASVKGNLPILRFSIPHRILASIYLNIFRVHLKLVPSVHDGMLEERVMVDTATPGGPRQLCATDGPSPATPTSCIKDRPEGVAWVTWGAPRDGNVFSLVHRPRG